MKTSKFWEYCERVGGTRSRNQKRSILGEMYSDHYPSDVGLAAGIMTGDPFIDFEANMGVGKRTMRKAVVNSFKESKDEIREIEKEKGSLTETIPELTPTITLHNAADTKTEMEDLGAAILDISEMSGNAKIGRISDYLMQFEDPHVVTMAVLSPRKDLSIGVSWKTFRDIVAEKEGFHPTEVEVAYGLSPNIRTLVNWVASSGELASVLEPLDRIQPQLASSKDLPTDHIGWVGQTKFDGGRLIIHRYDREITAYTRQQHEISENLPELQDVDWPDCEFIVDSEAVGYDPETGEPLPFQKFMERFQREKDVDEKAKEVEIKFKVFDALYLGPTKLADTQLWRAPYSDRLEQLEEHFPDEVVVDCYDDLEECFENAIENGHEGIIAKDMSASYKFLRDDSWRKVKPVKEPVDLRVSEVIRGTGRLSDRLGALKIESNDGVPLGKVGTGFSDKDRKELWQMHQKEGLIGEIIEIEFEELQERDGNYGLRFPRYLRHRPEGEADDLERVKSL